MAGGTCGLQRGPQDLHSYVHALKHNSIIATRPHFDFVVRKLRGIYERSNPEGSLFREK